MRAVLDTNVLVSAVLSQAGASGAIVALWRQGAFSVVTSQPLVAELERVLSRPALLLRVPSPALVRELLEVLPADAEVVAPDVTLDAVVRDPADNRVLEAAVAGDADYIVSGDRDLLELREYAGIPILPPAQFIAMLEDPGSEVGSSG